MADTDFALHVHVPDVVSELCTPRLLTTEWVPGVHIDKASCVLPADTATLDFVLHPLTYLQMAGTGLAQVMCHRLAATAFFSIGLP